MKAADQLPLAALNPTTAQRPIVVQVSGLKKVYRTGFWLNQKVVPLKSCSFSIFQGETFGLLGPNGAGKTTLLKTLLGIVRPTAGQGVLLSRPLGDRAVKRALATCQKAPISMTT